MEEDFFGKFRRVEPEKQHPSAEMILAYEEAHLKLLKDYSEEIQLIQNMLGQLRKEQKEFYQKELPEIREAMQKDDVSPEIQEQWISEMQENIEHSFQLSTSLIRHYVTENLNEFEQKLHEAISKV